MVVYVRECTYVLCANIVLVTLLVNENPYSGTAFVPEHSSLVFSPVGTRGNVAGIEAEYLPRYHATVKNVQRCVPVHSHVSSWKHT
jgi:hypothetical protein